MDAAARLPFSAVVCAVFAFGCGDPATVILSQGSAPGQSTAAPRSEDLEPGDADPETTVDAGRPADAADFAPDCAPDEVQDGPEVGPAPPPPPPSEPPPAAQPPAVTGAKHFVADTWVESVAGSDEAGLVDGIGPQVRFHNPVNVKLGPDGSLYVADFDNDRIRRVTRSGSVTTLTDAPELFRRPFGLAFDDFGEFFVQTDGDPFGARSYYTATIWRVDPQTGDASSLAADIGRTRGLVPLLGGGLLLTDNAWHSARRLDTDRGTLTHVAGSRDGEAGYRDGLRDAVRFFRPYGAARLPNGHIVVADARNHCLRDVAVTGAVTTLLGKCGQPGYVDGPRAGVLFNFPQDVAVDDAGELVVTDRENHCIRLIAPDGTTSTLAGDGVEGHIDGPGPIARFRGQEGLDITPDGRTVYVADGDLSLEASSHYVRAIHRADAPP